MKKFVIPALAALALGACAEAEAPADDTAADTGGDTTIITPTATETAVVPVEGADMSDTDDESSLTIDGESVDATIDEDGVNAEVDVDTDN